MTVRTRYAPSPTGYMHIGNLRTALYAYLFAKKNNGIFILRIEDTDQARYVEDATRFIYETLAEVGLKHDEGPDVGGEYGPYVQSERKDLYQKYADELIEKGAAYRCFCSKERLDALRAQAEKNKVPFKYDGHCKRLTPEQIQAKIENGEPFVIRQAIPDTGVTSFHDEVYGTVSTENTTLGDGVLMKTDGFPTYNFANVIDDHLMAISHVMRGNEYLSSTPRYVLLYNAFGWDVPAHIHLPPIMKSSTEKFSKRHGDASFHDLVARGYLREAILNYIALLGWSPGTEEEIFTLDELVDKFSLDGLSKSAAVFDINKLKWMNGEYIRKLTPEAFLELARPYFGFTPESDEQALKLADVLQVRTEVLSDITDQIDFVQQLPDYNPDLYINKKMKTDLTIALSSLEKSRDVLDGLPDWNHSALHDALIGLATTLGIKNGQIMYPVRVALSGKEFTPGGAIELADLFGKAESLRRIDVGIDKLRRAVQ